MFAILIILLIGIWSYVAWRGLQRNEFRRLYSRGWHHSPRYSAAWWGNIAFIVINLSCLMVALIVFAYRGELGF